MKYLKTIIASLIVMSTMVHAEETTLDKARGGALELWEKTKTTTTEIADRTSKKASEMSEKASELGSEVSKNAKETSIAVWDTVKQVGSPKADSARKGASKIRSLVGQEECHEDSALCHKNKE